MNHLRTHACKRVDETAFRKAIASQACRLQDHVRRRIPVRLQGLISAEDVLQEVWIRAYRALPEFRPDGPAAFERWLTTITDHTLVSALRQATRKRCGGTLQTFQLSDRQESSLVDLFHRSAGRGRTPSREVSAKEASSAVRAALETLPPESRRAVWMRHIDGRSHAEIAQIMDRSIPAVRGLLSRGLRRLRSNLRSADRFLSGSYRPPATSVPDEAP